MSALDELRIADAVAAGLNRGLNVEPMRWSELLAIAQRELNDFQRRTYLRDSLNLYREEAASPLIAAARIVFEVATRSGADQITSNLVPGEFDESERSGREEALKADVQERHLLLVLASCAFGMYGNFPSAAAVQRRIDFDNVRSEAQWIALTICNPSILGTALRSKFLTHLGREFLELFNMLLLTGASASAEQAIEYFEKFLLLQASLAEITFLRGARLALKHCGNLAMARLRNPKFGHAFHGFIEKIIEDGRPCLLPPQYNVITNKFLDSRENAIVTIPTSTGKTLLGELAIAARINQIGDISIYVAPYIALGRQVFECLNKHKPDSVDVRGYYGSFNSHIDGIDPNRSTIIVSTPERLDAILRSHELYARLRTVVFDEAHGLEGGVRGARLEGLIARMRLQQRRGRDIRIILLSAVLADVSQIRDWLGASAEHYQDSWRPTARRLAIWTTDGKLSWLFGTDPLRPSTKNAVSMLGRKVLEWPIEMWPASSFGAMNAQKQSAYDNVAFLARYIRSTIGGPVLIACYAKQTTRGIAAAVASKLPENVDMMPPDRDRLLTAISRYPHLAPLAAMVQRGVAYHNASLPANIKHLIEDAIKSKSLEFVSATTTLAEGVDLPFRSTIIFDWLIGYGEKQEPMSPLLFRNIAGRCGRAGEFIEGDTIIFDNVLGSPSHVSDRSRRQAQRQLFNEAPVLRSVVANDNLPDDIKRSVRAAMSSQLMAAIPENPDDEAVEQSLSSSLYASYQGSLTNKLFEELRAELLSDADGKPFAKAASPMWLTELGQAANRTGFGPVTCRQMLSYLEYIPEDLDASGLGAELLRTFGNCEEQGSHVLDEVVAARKGSKLFVKDNDLSMLAREWLRGTPLIDIFVSLPKAGASKAAVSPRRWALGGGENEFVAAQYDKFVDLMEYAFGGFLPWILRAMASLSTVSFQQTTYNWSELAIQFERCRVVDEETVDIQSTFGVSDA